MTVLPIVERELRVASRQGKSYWTRLVAAGVAMALLGVALWSASLGARWSHSGLFQLLAWYGFVYCLFAGALATADCLSAEKRNDTFGLLFLTDLHGYDVVLGKLAASALGCFFGLLATLPILAVPLLMGGVQGTEFLRIAFSLVSTLLLSLAVGLLSSVLGRNPFRTTSAALLIMALLGLGLPLLSWWFDHGLKWHALAAWLRPASPFFAHRDAFSSGAWRPSSQFGPALFGTWIMALGAVLLSCQIATLAWRETSSASVWGRLHQQTAQWTAWNLGGGARRRSLRARLLNRNPFAWLAGREIIGSPGLLLLAAVVIILGGWAAAALPRGKAGLDDQFVIWLVVGIVLHCFTLAKWTTSACQPLAQDRSSGALELVLGTRLQVREIVRGQWQALRRQMLGPVLIVLLVHAWVLAQLLNLFFADSGWWAEATPKAIFIQSWRFLLFEVPLSRGWEEGLAVLAVSGAAIVLAAHWVTLGWVGMWMSLKLRQPRLAPWAALGLVLIPPWIVFVFILTAMLDYESVWTEERWFIVCFRVILLAHLIHDLMLSLWARRQLLLRFRAAAQERFVTGAPLSFKIWGNGFLRWASALGVLGLLLALFHWEENRRGQSAWNRLQAELAQRGERLEHPPPARVIVPPHLNFAEAPVVADLFDDRSGPQRGGYPAPPSPSALSSVSLSLKGGPRGYVAWDEGRSWAQQRATDLERWTLDYRAAALIPTNAAPQGPSSDILLAFRRFEGPLRELRNASQRPYCEIPDPGHDWRRSEVLCNVSEVLRYRASALLIQGSIEEAWADTALCLYLAEVLQGDRELLGAALQPIWEGLANGCWSPEQLVWFQARLEQFDLLSEYHPFCRTTMVEHIRVWERHRKRQRRGLWHVTGLFAPAGWIYQNQVDVYRLGQAYWIPLVDPEAQRVFPERARQAGGVLQRSKAFIRSTGNGPVAMAARLARVQTAVNQALVACALERYRAQYGQYPAALAELTANGFLEHLPSDLVDGQPLRYRRDHPLRFVLYSLGWNAKDDGGLSRQDLDWVWKYPT